MDDLTDCGDSDDDETGVNGSLLILRRNSDLRARIFAFSKRFATN